MRVYPEGGSVTDLMIDFSTWMLSFIFISEYSDKTFKAVLFDQWINLSQQVGLFM